MSDDVEVLGEGRFLRLVSRKTWEFVQRPNASAVVIVAAATVAGEAVLVEQYRESVRSWVIEWPAGLVGDEAGAEDESLTEAAARELEEETGYRAADLEIVTAGPPCVGLSEEIDHFLVARGLEKVGEGGGVGHERIVVRLVPLAQLADWLAAQRAAGRLVDPKVYTGLYFLERALAPAA
ncbi:MAG: NUDIX domain-containing protein [Acidobacteria bacterium]|nr:NUDIX domain-containing protein [Acidobacteriota bacterium]